MRIISGKFKSRVLRTPKDLPIRPTTDYAKESLFNILNNWYYFEDLTVLDLFTGTGSISFEFASRGSERVVSIDLNRDCLKFVESTIIELGIDSIMTANRMDAQEYVNLTSEKFNVVFADPPYDYEGYPELIKTILDRKLLKENGTLIIEHDKRHDFSDTPHFEDHRTYGNVNYSFFNLEE